MRNLGCGFRDERGYDRVGSARSSGPDYVPAVWGDKAVSFPRVVDHRVDGR